MRALFTGSRVYGFPTEESDLDIVVEVTKEELGMLMTSNHTSMYVFDGGKSYSFKFGKLNLIVEVEDGRFEKWDKATNACKLLKPMKKKDYLKIFEFSGISTKFNSDGENNESAKSGD